MQKKNNFEYSILSLILGNNDDEIKKFCNTIKKKGFAFVKLSPNMVKHIDLCVNIINNFFQQDIEYKESFFKKPIFGYFNAMHKESFRLLTGERINEQLMPNTEFKEINKLAHISDEIMYKLCMNCSKYLFPNIIDDAKKYDIPLFFETGKWGMLDFTKYFNNNTKNGLNCNAHADPGLLSIHYRSTQYGLQLFDYETKVWINPPNNKYIATIWAGNVAGTISNKSIAPGYHRVAKNFSNQPRIAIWYEVCTSKQERTDLFSKKKEMLSKKEHKTGIPSSKIVMNKNIN